MFLIPYLKSFYFVNDCSLQGIDLFSRNDNALMAALELHAMLVGKAIARDLPSGWVMNNQMPAPPLGPDGKTLAWSFDIPTQVWWARDAKGRALFPLQDSNRKYVIGGDFVPGGWEVSREGGSCMLSIEA